MREYVYRLACFTLGVFFSDCELKLECTKSPMSYLGHGSNNMANLRCLWPQLGANFWIWGSNMGYRGTLDIRKKHDIRKGRKI